MSTLSVPIKLFHPTTTTSSFLHSQSQTLTFIPSRTPTVRASASTLENPHKAFGKFLRQRLYFNTPNGALERGPACATYVQPGLRVRCIKKENEKEEVLLEGMPKEYYDDEWQARQREETKELHQLRKEEDEEEERKMDEYREIGMRLKGYPEQDVIKARKLVSSFILAAEEIEEKIEEAAEKGELNELVLMVIWNRLDLARRDEEKDAIRSLDLLYRRVETEILRREATPAMRLLNELLIMYDGFDFSEWLKKCKKIMIDVFPREDPFSVLIPPGFESFDIDKLEGPLRPTLEDDGALLRVDFVREVDALLQEVRADQSEVENAAGFDPQSVANRLKQQEKQQTIRQVEALLDLAIGLTW
ncbi:protein PALE CRESS, chloroplastic isoform X2 [Arachis duranensis]|uniref:Protein PALE CRESS, chloroplastic isoform X2 n=1 Tax=Arachis duranensis TaxID=130453 RepID=A0A6P4BVW4_ARADU|nr:protein PALE CRESS, chloroplastic isoform X2 [Arachis duranensis]